MEWNVQLFRAINDIGKDYTFLNPFFVLIAEYTIYVLILALVVYWFTRIKANRVMIISAILSFVLAEIVGKSLGLLHFNYQPFVDLTNVNQLIEKEIGNSFPSDHTMIFFTVCFTFFFFRTKFKYFWFFLAILVGLSRIWAGVHYPADVLVGAIVGIGAAYACSKITPKSIQKLLSKWDQQKSKSL